MGSNVIAMLRKKDQSGPTLKAAAAMIENMDRRAKGRRDRGDFYDSFRTDLRSKDQPEQSSEQLAGQASGHSVRQMPRQLSEQTGEQTTKQTSEQTGEQTDLLLPELNLANKPSDLTDRQFIILHHIYFRRPFTVSGKNGLEKYTGIKYSNIRNNLRCLVRKGYIQKPFRTLISPTKHGSNCVVIEEKCLPIFGPSPIANPQMKNKQTSEQTSRQTTEQTKALNSSCSIKNTTTLGEIEKGLNHPALNQWRQWGLRSQQIDLWLKQRPDVSLNDIWLSLRHVVFRFIDQGYLEERSSKKQPIEDKISWFWATFKNRGLFIPAPEGYVSWEAKRAQQIKSAADQLKKDQLDLIVAERDMEFETMMSNSDGELFAFVYKYLNDFNQKRYKKLNLRKSPMFREVMRIAFDKWKNHMD